MLLTGGMPFFGTDATSACESSSNLGVGALRLMWSVRSCEVPCSIAQLTLLCPTSPQL